MRREDGQVTVMTIGFLLFVGLLAVVVINSSAAFLERQRLDNMADGAALSAADGLSRATFYRRGEVTLDGAQARRLVGRYVGGDGVRIVRVTTDDEQVSVRLERSIDLALAPPGWDSQTTIVSEATAQLRLGD
ncbi:pilus assembly protein TadG-related protein [Aeromicrobium stalagmiti]|uniref:pilus assembly protein TadG-related protein n=1 Tax=Aeromicrobium stalagmiti TaxID=2738988 RepID=UPI001567E105|nr:Tad domain-containing protein [Aeromicrobium stalagmiti]